ncbi:hypothetical protein LPJ73_004400, partial [Coemansia sp. RSA 2703]
MQSTHAHTQYGGRSEYPSRAEQDRHEQQQQHQHQHPRPLQPRQHQHALHVAPPPAPSSHPHPHAHSHSQDYPHDGISQQAGMGPGTRPHVSPLPHLHVLMAQSQQQQQQHQGGAAGAHQFGNGGRGGGYDIRAGAAYADSDMRSSGGSNVVRSMYPSTLLPTGHIHAQHQLRTATAVASGSASAAAPVKLLQSCDSCRRRKIRCSGEKPTCSACVRYQETCHYSPLATPRRRAGKRARTTAGDEEAHVSSDLPAASAGRSARGSSSVAETPPAQAGDEHPVASDLGDPADVRALRVEVLALARRFDALDGKLDRLLDAMGAKRRKQARWAGESESDGDSDHTHGSDSEEDDDSDTAPNTEFSSLIDKTSRFGIDATNVGVISEMISRMSGQPSAGVHVSSGAPGDNDGDGEPTAGVLAALVSAPVRAHLLDTFFEHADVNMIAFIPRHIFSQLQKENRVPTSMVNVMLADACNYSDACELQAVGRAHARGYFIERAYRALFECLEYDSAEHCVAILLFAMVISKAGLHRAWIMHSLSSQMAIRLRFNTLDSPLSAPAFARDPPVVREWKRRVFWQLYAFDVQSATLSDLPPCLSLVDVRCNPPSVVLPPDELAVLGPAVVLCDDPPTVALQVELLGILCDIHATQSRLTPEHTLFPPEFHRMHERVLAWRARVPLIDLLESGDLPRIADALGAQPGRVFLALLAQYALIFLCLVKDTWLPTTRPMTPQEVHTLQWTRRSAYDAAQAVHRLVPLVRALRLSALCPFVSCVVFQACV